MKLVGCEVFCESYELEEPYAITYQSVARADNVFVRFESDSGALGWGCVNPDPDVTGETAADVAARLEAARAGLLGQKLDALAPLLDVIGEGFRGARSAVNIAWHDLSARAAGKPLWQWLGGQCRPVLTSITIGILPVAPTVERAADWVAQGFRCLKIKGGHSLDSDVERILKVRERVGPDVLIRFDANQGYDVAQTLLFARRVVSAGVEFIEQPTPVSAGFAALKALSETCPIPVMADELVFDTADVAEVVKQRACSLVNLKLAKAGGVAEARRAAELAHRHNVKCMVGCMDDAALGIAAGLHLLLATPGIVFADLDGHIGLRGDRTAAAVQLQDGHLVPAAGPGLGVML